MFNRELRMDVVKRKKSQPTVEGGSIDTSFEDKAAVAAAVAERVIKKISFGVCAYVVLDTVRRVVVESASA
ncbi:MAG: hypothetical protein ABWY25_07460 [Paenisporosarcina sp.]